MIAEYIDTSYYSIALGAITFVIIFLLVKFSWSKYYTMTPELSESGEPIEQESTDYKILGLCALVALIMTVIVLVGFKQYLVYKGSRTILDEQF